MYGHLLLVLQGYVKERFKDESWREIQGKCGLTDAIEPRSEYDDGLVNRWIEAAVAVLGLPRETFLMLAGEYYLEYSRRIGYDELLRNLGANLLQFVENLDYLHTYIMSEYPEVNMPSFRCESDSVKDRMTLHYYSFRKGLHYLAVGIISAAAKTYFKSELKVDVISESMEFVAEGRAPRHHVVLSISATELGSRRQSGPPTLIAQTNKNSEKQIMKGDIDRVLERLDEIRQREGADALPLTKQKKKGGVAKWKSVAKMSALFGGFTPAYPSSLSFDAVSFCNAFPYHVAFKADMAIVHSGVTIQKLMPGIRTQGATVGAFFDMLHPHSVDLQFANINKFINTPFVLKTKQAKMMNTWGKKPMIILRGQMVSIPSHNTLVYLCSPFVRSLKDVEQRSMHLGDIPIHDVTRDLLWMELMARSKESKEDERRGAVFSSPIQRMDSNDPDVMKDELNKIRQQLDDERRTNRWLHGRLLPPSIADQITAGKQHEAEKSKCASVLFADLVEFTSILNKCKPTEVVSLLSRLHSAFNRVCSVHAVFRVEAVGDAYMVVSGVPNPLKTHAERIANTALGLLMSAQEMTSRYTYEDGDNRVKIRIGVHSGSVVGGVIGVDIPRYLVMGDAVNMAARIESHGVPNKIHISEKTHSLLKQKPFRMEKRGEVTIRNQGKMTTHFLLSNTQATRSQLLGLRESVAENEVTFINEGQLELPPPLTSSGQRSPMMTRNKVTPLSSTTGTPTKDKIIAMSYVDNPSVPDHRHNSQRP